jgi:hypothetical protein
MMNCKYQLEPLVLEYRLRGTSANQLENRSGASALLSLALNRALGPMSMTPPALQSGCDPRREWSIRPCGRWIARMGWKGRGVAPPARCEIWPGWADSICGGRSQAIGEYCLKPD